MVELILEVVVVGSVVVNIVVLNDVKLVLFEGLLNVDNSGE